MDDRPHILDRIGKAFQQTYEGLVHEIPPERWTDLIIRLH